MSHRVRAMLTLAGFVIVLAILVSLDSAVLNNIVAVLILAAFFIGSVVLLMRWLTSRRPAAFFFGQQLQALPASWRRWLLAENNEDSRHRR